MLRMLGLTLLVSFLALVVILVLRARDALADRAARRLSAPDRRHLQALERARKQLRRAEKAHARRVRAARNALADAGRDAVLVEVGPVVLGPCTVTLKKVVHELSAATTFRVDVEGEVRQVLTRRGDQEQSTRDDQREVYLTVTDETWADVVKLPPAQLEGARRLEVVGAAAVRNLHAALEERDARVLAARAELERVLADTDEIDTARMTVEDLAGVGPRTIDVPEPPEGDLRATDAEDDQDEERGEDGSAQGPTP